MLKLILIKLKGESYVVDNRCGANHIMAFRICEQLYIRRIHPSSACACNYRRINQFYSGPKNHLVKGGVIIK